MPKFHPLVVTDIHKTIRDAVVLTLVPETDADFDFVQGQYLTFRRTFDSEELRRSYSICAGKNDGKLQVGIKLVDGGTFSTWANTELSVGDIVEAMPPMGNFYVSSPQPDAHYLAFAVGSGITPILSILKTALSNESKSRFTLVYANRNPNTIMFREELEDLKNEYMGRLTLVHMLKDGSQDIDLFRGRIDSKKCNELFDQWIDVGTVTTAFICGPEMMMKMVAESLKDHGLDKDKIRYELFASNQPGRTKAPAKTAALSSDGVEGQVTIGGETRTFNIVAQTSLLDAALSNNLDAPHACKAGVCSTCKAKVLEGEVEMVANHALEDYEVEAGYVLTCQSYPVSESKVAWDYDQVGH